MPWLIKSEPSAYSWDTFVKEGIARWDGVRNFAARLNLVAMQEGDACLYYHSNEGKEIVGIAKVAKTHYPDPTAEAGESWVAVDVKPDKALKKPVTLAQIKADPKLKDMALVKLSRLSVGPVTDEEYAHILKLGGL